MSRICPPPHPPPTSLYFQTFMYSLLKDVNAIETGANGAVGHLPCMKLKPDPCIKDTKAIYFSKHPILVHLSGVFDVAAIYMPVSSFPLLTVITYHCFELGFL